MLCRPPRSSLTSTLFPYTTPFRAPLPPLPTHTFPGPPRWVGSVRRPDSIGHGFARPPGPPANRPSPATNCLREARLRPTTRSGWLEYPLECVPHPAPSSCSASLRSEEHTFERQPLRRLLYASFCL